MEIQRVIGNVTQFILDLISNALILGIKVFERDAALLFEWHLEIAVDAGFGIAADEQRIDLPVFHIGRSGKIANWRFDGRLVTAVPVDAESQRADGVAVQRGPARYA